jgi:CMP-N-acetylneuraminic acid synthetase
VEFLIRRGKILDEDSICFYPMSRENSIDIDEEFDLLLAQTLLSKP